jgi:predicted Zn-dependent protease
MSAATIHRPTGRTTEIPRANPCATSVPSQREARPTTLRLLPPVERPAARPARVRAERVAPSAVPSVQLTRRGRVAVLAVLLVAGLGMMIGLSGVFVSAAASTAPSRPATRTMVVQPGQTLWSIAAQVAPNADRRDTIARIVELNALPNSGISAGERIAVPTH